MAKVLIERVDEIIYLRWPKEFNQQDVERAVVSFKATLAQRPRSACINDARQLTLSDSLSKAMSKVFGDFIRDNKEFLEERTLCWADASASAWVRAFARGIRFFTQPAWPADSFATIEEAEEYCRGFQANAKQDGKERT